MDATTSGQTEDDEAPQSCCTLFFGRRAYLSKKPLSRADCAAQAHTSTKSTKGRCANSAKTALELIFNSSGTAEDASEAEPIRGQADDAAAAKPPPPPRPQTVQEELREQLGWELGKVLGTGHFATVMLGRRLVDGTLAAVKVIENPKNERERGLAKKEIEILKRVEHAYCVRCYDAYETQNRTYLFMELMEGG